ncbi:MAG: penicillin-binding protein 2 [Sphaerochaetaceae bacterium]|nr:penicillin-binding protein 2 [Sphaerochaetaceae bacterium]
MVSSPKRRFYCFFLSCIILAQLLLLSRVVYIVMTEDQQRRVYQNPEIASQVVRGTIYDRNGRIFAMETPYWSCAFLLKNIPDLQIAAELVSPYTGLAPQQVLSICGNYSTYAMIQRKLDDDQVEPLRQAIRKAKLGEGIIIEKKYGRSYPATFHGVQTVGFTNVDNRGIEGIELAYDQELSPYPRLGENVSYGDDIYLTIDLDIQYLLDLQVQRTADRHNPDYIMAVVMDAASGDILATTSYPWYDPNRFNLSDAEQRQNRLLSYMYEPGSVFKIYSLAACMEAGQADFDEPFHCDGSYTFSLPSGQRVTINCVSPHGDIDRAGMVKHSCNGAIVHWALQTDDQRFYDMLRLFHFGQRWNIGLQGGITGSLPKLDSWSGRTKATLSFGQELGVNALQMTAAATVFTNDGVLLQPNLIKKIVSHDGTVVSQSSRTEVERVLSPGIAKDILSYMVSATEPGGTGVLTAVEGFTIAAKTGTAQILNPETNSYSDGSVLASTLAIVPAEQPKYIIYMAAAHPKGNTIWGSNIAAPAISQVIQGLASQGKLTSEKATVI